MNESEGSFAWQAFRLNWLPIVAMGTVLLVAIACTAFSLEPLAFGTTIAIGLSPALIAYGSALAFADPKLIFWFGSTAQVILVTAIVGPLSYVANALNCPLQDHTLLLIDRAIGLDPQLIAAFVNDHSWLVKYLNNGYGLIKWPLLGIPIALTMVSRLIRLQQFVLALNIALAVTIVISIFVPAVGTYYGLNLSPAERFPLLDSSNYVAQLRDIVALRNGSLRHLELFKLVGIVSFPSFPHSVGCSLLLGVMAGSGLAVGNDRPQHLDDSGHAGDRRALRHRCRGRSRRCRRLYLLGGSPASEARLYGHVRPNGEPDR